MKTKLVFFDVHDSDKLRFERALGDDFELVITDQSLTGETISLAKDADALAIHITSPVTASVMQQLPNLKHIACRTTGYDHVDLRYAAAHNITVSTIPSYGESTVAEYAFMLMLAVSRRLMQTAHSVLAGTVIPEKLTGHDLFGKTLGLVGTGKIGRHVAMIARGFGMKVVAYDPYPNEAAAKELGFEYVPLETLFSSSDYITLHAPATPQNTHLLNADAFKQMKRGVFIVNTARGALIDTGALIEALESGQVGGAGLDVLEGEDLLNFSTELQLLGQKDLGPKSKQLLRIDILSKMPNVLLTSHNAYNSDEALARIAETTIENIRAWHKGNPENLVKPGV